MQQRFQFGLQPALLKNIPLSHPAPILARVYCYFIYWCLTEVFVGFLCVYSPNPSLVPWKRDFMLFSTSLARDRIWHTVGNFAYLWKTRGREGISKFSFSLKKLPKVFLDHVEYLKMWARKLCWKNYTSGPNFFFSLLSTTFHHFEEDPYSS